MLSVQYSNIEGRYGQDIIIEENSILVETRKLTQYVLVTSLMLVGVSQASNTEKTPWDDQESPNVVYSQFLKYAGNDVRATIEYNEATNRALSKMYSKDDNADKVSDQASAEKSPLDSLKVVAAHTGSFFPLNTWTGNTYCSRLILQNLNSECVAFLFLEDVIPRVLGLRQVSKKMGQEAKVAYRNIVPSLFRQASSLAGPMGLHEFLVEGNGIDFKKESIIFVANKDRDVTPLEVYFKNCSGIVGVNGIDSNNTIFHCSGSPDLEILYTDEYERDNGADGSEDSSEKN